MYTIHLVLSVHYRLGVGRILVDSQALIIGSLGICVLHRNIAHCSFAFLGLLVFIVLTTLFLSVSENLLVFKVLYNSVGFYC